MYIDLRIFQVHYIMGRFLGFTGKKNLIHKIYIFVFIIMSIFLTFFSIRIRQIGFWPTSSESQIIIDTCLCLEELVFLLSMYVGAIKNTRNWSRLFKLLKHFDQEFSKSGFQVKLNVPWYIAKMLILHLFLVWLNSFEILSWISMEEIISEFGYILSRSIGFYKLYIILLVFSVTRVYKARLIFLSNLLDEVISENKIELKTKKLRNLKRYYACWEICVRYFNKIFGHVICWNVMANTLNCLEYLNIFLTYGLASDIHNKLDMLTANFLYVFIDIVSKTSSNHTHFIKTNIIKTRLKLCFFKRKSVF